MDELLKSPRNRLIIAAERLFQAYGFRSVGIDLILQEAETAKASLYQHFSSKDELITEVLRLKSRKTLSWLRGKVEHYTDRNPQAAIIAIFDAYANWFEEDGFTGCLFSKACLEYPDKAHPVRKAAAAHTRKLFCYLEEICQDANVPATMAEHLLILLEGATEVATKTGAGRAPADRAWENIRQLLAA